jgi:hypothetical protein
MLLNKQLTSNYQLVELQIPANSPNQKFSFTDQPLLRDKAIEKIECYNFGAVSNSPAGYPATLPTLNVYVTFATDGGDEFIQNIAGLEFNAINNYGVAGYLNLNGGFSIGLRKIIFPKSYITFSQATPIGTPYSFLFGIYYK